MIDTPTKACIRFPLTSGDFAGCFAALIFENPPSGLEDLVPNPEPCEGRCGARVAASEMSGEQLGVLAVAGANDALARLELPAGLWEAPHPDEHEGDPVVAVVFHDAERCRWLRDHPEAHR